MKLQTIGVLAIAALSFGCQGSRLDNIEKQVAELEQRTRQLESERKKLAEDEDAKRTKLELCLFEANSNFDNGLKSNGAKGRGGNYSVPVAVMAELDRQRQAKVEECKLLYAK